MGIYSMLTSRGVSEINTAQPETGILIEVTHWVGAFDAQLSADYATPNNTDWNDIANYTSPDDTYPNEYSSTTGDVVYWKTTPDDLETPNKNDLYTGVSYQSVADMDTKNYIGVWVVPAGVDPTTVSYPSGTPDKGDYWLLDGDITKDGITYSDNTDPGGPNADKIAWNGIAWVNATNNDTNYRGNFKVLVTADTDKDPDEEFLVNKVAIYGIKRSEDGIVLDDPYLLGQVILPDAQLIKGKNLGDSSSFSVDELIIDFQIDTAAVVVDFDNIIYASQNDYWSRVTSNDGQYGLQYDGQVFISNKLGIEDTSSTFPSNDDVGVGKLLVATWSSVNKANTTEEHKLPQLVLQYNDYKTTAAVPYTQRIRTTLKTNEFGDCELDFYGSCANEYGYYSLVPKVDKLFGLGNDGQRWKSVKASELFELFLGKDTKIPDSVNENGSYGYVTIGRNSYSSDSRLGLGLFGNSSIIVGPYIDDLSVNTSQDLSNYYYMYGNISNYTLPISDSTTFQYNLGIRSTQNTLLYSMSKDYTSSKEFDDGGSGGDAEATMTQIRNLAEVGGDSREADGDTRPFVKGIIDSEYFKKFFDKTKWSSAKEGVDRIHKLREIIYGDAYGGDVKDITTAKGDGINRDVYIAAQRFLFTNGDVVPMIDGLNNLGTHDHRYKDLYIDTIHGAKHAPNTTSGYGGWNLLEIDADIVPVSDTNKITRSRRGYRFERIDCKNLGQGSDYIDRGYITNIHGESIDADNADITYITSTQIGTQNIDTITINGYDFNDLINDVSYSQSFSLKLSSGDHQLDRGNTTYVSGGSATYTFEFTINAVADTEKLKSCMVIVESKGMKTKNTNGHWTGGQWQDLLHTDNNTSIKDMLKSFVPEDIVKNTSFLQNSTSNKWLSCTQNNGDNMENLSGAVSVGADAGTMTWKVKWGSSGSHRWDKDTTVTLNERTTLSIV